MPFIPSIPSVSPYVTGLPEAIRLLKADVKTALTADHRRRATIPLAALLQAAPEWGVVPTVERRAALPNADPELSDDDQLVVVGGPPALDWESENPGVVLHHSTQCCGCGEFPIIDRRYHCSVCDLDMCEVCVGRGVNDRTHTLTTHFQSEHPRPPGPLRFAIQSILAHCGRRVGGVDQRHFNVRFKGSYWKDEQLTAAEIDAALISEYDQLRKRKAKRVARVAIDPVNTMIAAKRRRRIKRKNVRASVDEAPVLHPLQLSIVEGNAKP